MLDETQRRIFDRLAVFAGSFTIEAAEAVVSGDGVDEWEVLDGMLALVDKSLVIADETADATRYRLLETMRQFGNANLTAVDIDALWRDRYADYVLSRRPHLHGSGDMAALEDVEREIENIRVALRQAVDDRSSSRFEELLSATYTLWQARGRNSEGASWAAELLGRPDLDPRARIVALGFAASVTSNTSLAVAEEMAAAAADLSATTGAAPPLVAMSAMNLCDMMQGRTDAALAGCDRVMEMIADEPELFIRGWALLNCIAVLATCGASERLDAHQRDLDALAEQLDNRHLQASGANSLAPIIHVFDPEGAHEYLLRACALNDELGNTGANSTTTMFLALHELRSGDAGAAAQWARRSLELCVDVGPSFIAQTTNAIVAIVKRASPSDAAVLLGALRAHRARKQQVGTEAEIDAEARYETSLRRALGDQFDARYAEGLALDETDMIANAFTQLEAIATP